MDNRIGHTAGLGPAGQAFESGIESDPQSMRPRISRYALRTIGQHQIVEAEGGGTEELAISPKPHPLEISASLRSESTSDPGSPEAIELLLSADPGTGSAAPVCNRVTAIGGDASPPRGLDPEPVAGRELAPATSAASAHANTPLEPQASGLQQAVTAATRPTDYTLAGEVQPRSGRCESAVKVSQAEIVSGGGFSAIQRVSEEFREPVIPAPTKYHVEVISDGGPTDTTTGVFDPAATESQHPFSTRPPVTSPSSAKPNAAEVREGMVIVADSHDDSFRPPVRSRSDPAEALPGQAAVTAAGSTNAAHHGTAESVVARSFNSLAGPTEMEFRSDSPRAVNGRRPLLHDDSALGLTISAADENSTSSDNARYGGPIHSKSVASIETSIGRAGTSGVSESSLPLTHAVSSRTLDSLSGVSAAAGGFPGQGSWAGAIAGDKDESGEPQMVQHSSEPQEIRAKFLPRAARSLLVELPAENGGDDLRLRFVQRRDSIDVRIRAGSERLAQELRSALPVLMERLEAGSMNPQPQRSLPDHADHTGNRGRGGDSFSGNSESKREHFGEGGSRQGGRGVAASGTRRAANGGDAPWLSGAELAEWTNPRLVVRREPTRSTRDRHQE